MKLKKSLQLLTLSVTLPSLSATAILNSLESSPVLADESNPTKIDVYNTLNNQQLTDIFNTTPTIATLIRCIKAQFSTLAAYVNQLEFGTQTNTGIQVKAYS
jgi:hypothetical protein